MTRIATSSPHLESICSRAPRHPSLYIHPQPAHLCLANARLLQSWKYKRIPPRKMFIHGQEPERNGSPQKILYNAEAF